jgi:hypothetical protein
VIRLRPPGVTALEVWDTMVGGQTIFAWQRHPAFPEVLAELVQRLVRDPPPALPEQARALLPRVAHVHLTGGGAERPGLLDALRTAGIRASIAYDPCFAAARAGSHLAAARPLVCADVGQTSVKLAAGARAIRVPRDEARAPLRDRVPPPERDAARRSTVDFLAAALASLGDLRPAWWILALPAELDDACATSSCSYAWPDPDPALLGDLASAAGLPPDRIGVLNDAELAAVSAAHDPRTPRGAPTLVLTLGFGVGAALLELDREEPM